MGQTDAAVENLVASRRRNRFIKRHGETDNNIYVKWCSDPFRLFGCIFIALVQVLFSVFIHSFCATI